MAWKQSTQRPVTVVTSGGSRCIVGSIVRLGLVLRTWIVVGFVVAAMCLAAYPASGETGAVAPPPRVAILIGAKSGYRAAAASLTRILKENGYECTLIKLPKRGDETGEAEARARLERLEPTLVATGGAAATTLALRLTSEIPVVFFMVPNALDAEFMSAGGHDVARVAGVTSDISPYEQVRWITQLLPKLKILTVLHSPRTRITAAAIRDMAERHRLRCETIEADKTSFPRAIEALNRIQCDGTIMIPDARVYSSPTVQRLVLWGVRQHKAVWAFSENLVKAGALGGLYPDAAAIGRQTAGIVQDILSGAKPNMIGLQYPDQIGRAVNVRTAGTIGVSLKWKHVSGATVRFGE